MYAVRPGSGTYHLFDARSGLTVCGLRVSPIRVKVKSRAAPLRRTPTKPLDKAICKHCVRLSAPRG